MGLDFVGFYRKLTTSRLKVTGQCEIGDKAIIAGTGKTYYVDSGATNAADTNNGRSWSAPCATVDGAINKCTSNQGDVILVAEGHSETWTTTGAKLTADIVGITIIGLGTGSNRPTFTFSHVSATWTISAANVTLCNLLLVTNVDLVTTYGTISGADCTLVDIETRDTTNKEVVDDFTVTGDRFKVYNYFKNGYTSGDANARVFNMTGVDNALFQDCIFMTKVTTGIINFTGTSCTNVVAKKCVFYVNSTTDGSKNIVDTIGSSTKVSFECTDLSSGAVTTGNISTVTDALYGGTGIASFPAGAAAANDVSLAEVLRYTQENICRGGTILPATQSIYDLIAGTNGIASFPAGVTAGNSVSLAEVVRFAQENIINGGTALPATQSLYDVLAGANGIATFPVGAAPTNNVSLAEVVRDIWDVLRNGTGGTEPATNLSLIDELKKGSLDIANPRYITLAIDMTSVTWNTQAVHEILTVTGLVRLRIWAECTSTLTDAGNGATIQLGVEGATNAWIAASDTDNIVTGSVWADNTPGDTNGDFSSLVLDKVVNGLDVGYEIAGEAVTGGAITFHCVWEPLNATGAVVVGAGGVL